MAVFVQGTCTVKFDTLLILEVTMSPGGQVAVGRLPSNAPAALSLDARGYLYVTAAYTQYPEDSPSAPGDPGNLILVVRNDAGGSLVNANGDYTALQVDNNGSLYVTPGGPAGAMVITQAVHDLLNGNANIQVGDVDVAPANPVPVNDAGGSLTVDNPILSVVGGGAEATAQRVTIANDSSGVLTVDDGGGSLTVDNPILSVVGGGAEAAAQRVTIANDSTGVLSVDDNGGSLTVDQATHDNLNANANIQVGDVDVAAGNPVPTEEQEVVPTDAAKNNPSFVLNYTNGDLTSIVMTIGVGVYTKTLGYTTGDLTSISVWV